MPSIADTIRSFQARQAEVLAAGAAPGTDRLRRLDSFGSNPGALNAWHYIPDAAEGGEGLPLVVVLHGCTQTAAGYDRGSGWSDLAERFGFAVLFAEQQRANNANLCFNWFLPDDIRRGGGEALSIQQMIEAMSRTFAIDCTRVFVTGLSAGGAMANVMLATYPELFAGGSIIAGLPFGTASSVPQALERMRGTGLAGEADHAALVRRASPHRGPWPAVTVWHGDADRTVDIRNADAIVGQWRVLHGAGRSPDRTDTVDGERHRVWLGRDGQVAVEEYRIAGLGHGTPLKTRGADSCGVAGPHMLEAGISSTWRQAERWGLLGVERETVSRRASSQGPEVSTAPPAHELPAGIAATIERALRSAGLMRP